MRIALACLTLVLGLFWWTQGARPARVARALKPGLGDSAQGPSERSSLLTQAQPLGRASVEAQHEAPPSLRLVDAESARPIPGAQVLARRAPGLVSARPSDEAGVWTPDLAETPLYVSAAGYVPRDVRGLHARGAGPTEVRLQPLGWRSFDLVVLDRSGVPVPGARIELSTPDHPQAELQLTDRAGRARFRMQAQEPLLGFEGQISAEGFLPARFRGAAPGGAEPRVWQVGADAEATAVVLDRAGSVHGLVLGSDGRAAVGAVLTVEDPNHPSGCDGSDRDALVQVASDALGRYRIDGLPLGRPLHWRLCASEAAGGIPASGRGLGGEGVEAVVVLENPSTERDWNLAAPSLLATGPGR